jgi:enoyl-CoA hydratase
VPLHIARHGRVALLTLDEPERRNALTSELVTEIVAAMDSIDADADVGAVVLTGAPPAFCSGADVDALAAMAAGTEEPGDVRAIYAGFIRVLDSPLPTVAAVNGPAVGAGCNLALACDLRIAGRSARFDARFLRIGIHPGGGHTWLLQRAAGPEVAAAMNLFGARVDGETAVRVGLAWECVPDDELVERALTVATRAAEVPRELAVRTKATLRATASLTAHDEAMRTELEPQIWSLRQNFGPVERPR